MIFARQDMAVELQEVEDLTEDAVKLAVVWQMPKRNMIFMIPEMQKSWSQRVEQVP